MSKDGTPVVIGFDTSNYRTSVAAVTLDGEILVNHRELLPVSNGERGLRQSDAVFAHIRQLGSGDFARATPFLRISGSCGTANLPCGKP